MNASELAQSLPSASRAKLPTPPKRSNYPAHYRRPSAALIRETALAVAEARGIPLADVLSTAVFRRKVAYARWEVWRRLHIDKGFGLNPIAHAFGCDHTSPINARNRGWGA